MTGESAPRRVALARPAAAGLLGGLLLALAAAAVPLSRLAHQSLNASGGSLPVWFSAAYGAAGLVVAWRKPGNPLGWAAVLTQPGWAPTIALLGVAVLLFPDGRPPSRRWRWVLWTYLGVAALWIGGAAVSLADDR